MKVVLFCGGYGLRMRSGASDDVPKPMAMVGPRPLIWHVMRYYAYFGHTEFILCLGYGAHHIKNFFLNYEETTSNDFVLRGGRTELLSPTSPPGRSRSRRPVSSRRSGSGCAGCGTTWTATRCSSPTTPTCSPTPRCRR